MNSIGFKSISMFLIIPLFISCSKKEQLMESAELDNAMVLYEAEFTSAKHPTTGTATIQMDENKTILSFTDFKTDNGPKLLVYLSDDKNDSKFIDLGELKSTEGSFYYEVDPSIDFSEYDNVLIWCKSFSVLFGSAELVALEINCKLVNRVINLSKKFLGYKA
ncbi:DM13 domain-containing protein [Salibacteraceae bacterium]|nr:DM13 domain-containing protein [Salibacteraceae bacterium]MDC1220248.1 DM13 domain-containing protein [bacterium]MDC1304270.1 DM13 domain-containing protein [Salibacteraceae bacterium]